jgi:hypothetical protein
MFRLVQPPNTGKRSERRQHPRYGADARRPAPDVSDSVEYAGRLRAPVAVVYLGTKPSSGFAQTRRHYLCDQSEFSGQICHPHSRH